MQDNRKCSRCGLPLAADAPGGHCLRCLLGLGLKGETFVSNADAEIDERTDDDTYPGYQILEKLGEGGCGVVYRAEQIAPVRREVAIKVIKLGMDTRLVISRFEAERQMLELMNHPNIARVFDAGITGRGHPFFVMEFVAGENITAFCNQRNLSVSQRLEIFLQVCEGVRHAHLNGIIHRDLKPSNILIANVNGHPVPKVIDFGVAKAIDRQRLTSQTIYTVFDQIVGTPAYMSPEQAGLTGEGIDARSDVYSLGVLLHELLAGGPPFKPERLRRAALDEVCRIIREEEPPLPSAHLSSAGFGKHASIMARRQLAKKAGELRGDLDGIVSKAMHKDRNRRYDTASEMAADILRHLNHEPVAARPPGLLYNARKFARRHKLFIGTVAAVACSLLVGLAVSSWMFVKEKRAREALEQRAYLSDMNTAARAAFVRVGGLGSTGKLLATWRRYQPDLRGWEWYFLNGLCHQDLLTIRADERELWSVTWSLDGKRLATGGADGEVKLWDPTTGQALAALRGHHGGVWRVAWSPDGHRLASTGEDNTLRVWNIPDGSSQILAGHGSQTWGLAWSPDGQHLASGGSDGTVKIWNPLTGAIQRTISAGGGVGPLCWNRDGTRLFGGNPKGLFMCWDAATGAKIWGNVQDPRFSPIALACSPQGHALAVGGLDNAVSFCDATTGVTQVSHFDNQNAILAIAWSPDGSRVASATRGEGRITIREQQAGGTIIRDFRGHSGSVRAVCWSPDGARMASAGADGTMRIWDTLKKNPSLRALRQPEQGKTLAWSPDGSQLAVGSRRTDAWIWDFKQGGVPLLLDGGYTPWTLAVAWSPDGSRLATGGTEGLKLWNPATLVAVWQDPLTVKDIKALAWCPDGQRIAAVSGIGILQIWESGTGKPLQSHRLPEQETTSVAWSPDGQLLATGVGDGIHLWNEQLARIAILPGHREGIHQLAWSPDGTLLASVGGDSSAKIWDIRGRSLLQTLQGHVAPVYGVAWSPDGSRLVTGSWDMTVRIWDRHTGNEIASFDKPAGIDQMITAVAWSPDGRRIAFSDVEGCIGILDASPGWLAETGDKPAVPVIDPDQARAAMIRSMKIYCATVEPYAADDPDLLRRLAWLRATAPYPEIRDGSKAVRFAEQANQLTGGNNAGVLTTLAAAYAESGDFTNAIVTQKWALSLILTVERQAEFATALRLNRSLQPYRDEAW